MGPGMMGGGMGPGVMYQRCTGMMGMMSSMMGM